MLIHHPTTKMDVKPFWMWDVTIKKVSLVAAHCNAPKFKFYFKVAIIVKKLIELTC